MYTLIQTVTIVAVTCLILFGAAYLMRRRRQG
jgi:hypothetical protein